MAEYRPLTLTELNTTLFHSFQRRQVVTDCWRRVEGKWVIQPDPFIDDWTPEDYAFLVDCLKNTLSTGGMVYGAFIDGALKGFTSVEGKPLGSRGQYLDLTSIHVSRDARGHGIGKALYLGPLGGGDSGFLPGHGLCGGGGVPACPCGAGAL